MKRLLPFLVPSLFALLGCESPEPDPVDPAVEACTDYCAGAKEASCPQSGTCMDDCLALFDLACEAEMIDLLDCLGPALGADCVARDPDGKQTCVDQLHEHNGCVAAAVLQPEYECGPSEAASEGAGDNSCVGLMTCGTTEMGVKCDAAGACTCTVNGQPAGTCTKPIASAYFCAPHASCCTLSAFFE